MSLIWTPLPLVKSILTDISHTKEYFRASNRFATELFMNSRHAIKRKKIYKIVCFHYLLKKQTPKYINMDSFAKKKVLKVVISDIVMSEGQEFKCFLITYLHASEIPWVQFQTTKIKSVIIFLLVEGLAFHL